MGLSLTQWRNRLSKNDIAFEIFSPAIGKARSLLRLRVCVLVRTAVVEFRMQVGTALLRRLVLFGRTAIRIGPGVLTNAGHLPTNLHTRLAGPDREMVVADFFRNHGLGKLAYHRQLIAEVAVQGFEVVGQLNGRRAVLVGRNVAVVDVQHVWRFNAGVIKILVRRIERMVDLKILRTRGNCASDVEVAIDLGRAEEYRCH